MTAHLLATIERTERLLDWWGGSSWRALFEQRVAEREPWPDELPSIGDELRAWFAFHNGEARETTAHWRSARWAAARYQELIAEHGAAFPRMLVPIADERFLHAADGSLYHRDYTSDGIQFVPHEERDLTGWLAAIAAEHEARGASPWRRWRVALTEWGKAFEPVAAADVEALEDSLPGTAVISVASKGRRGATRWVRGQLAIKREDGTWLVERIRPGLPLDEDSPTRAVESLRWSFAYGYAPGIHDDETTLGDIRSLLARTDGPRDVARGRVRLWSQPSFDRLLDRLLAHLERDAPALRRSLAPPASSAALDAWEHTLGTPLPAPLRALYERFDGHASADRGSLDPRVYDQYSFLSLARAQSKRAGLLELAATQFGPAFWDPASAPFLGSPSSDALYVDLRGVHGPPGCVVDFNHERPAHREVLFESVTSWLECLVDAIDGGFYEYDRDEERYLADDLALLREHSAERTNGFVPWTRHLTLVG